MKLTVVLLKFTAHPVYGLFSRMCFTASSAHRYRFAGIGLRVALPVLFDKVTLPEWVTNDQLATLENFQITVVAEAIQADGFADAGAAWAAFNG